MSRSQEEDKCIRPEGKTSRSEEAKKDTHTLLSITLLAGRDSYGHARSVAQLVPNLEEALGLL